MSWVKIRVTVEFEVDERGLREPYDYTSHSDIAQAIRGENRVMLERLGRDLLNAESRHSLYRFSNPQTNERPIVDWKVDLVR